MPRERSRSTRSCWSRRAGTAGAHAPSRERPSPERARGSSWSRPTSRRAAQQEHERSRAGASCRFSRSSPPERGSVSGMTRKTACCHQHRRTRHRRRGCGGSGNTSSDTTEATPASEWADGFCTAITTWTTALTSVTTSSRISRRSRRRASRTAADDVKTATDTLVADLKGLGAPDTQSGQEVKSSIDELVDDARDQLDSIQTTVDDTSGITELPGAAAGHRQLALCDEHRVLLDALDDRECRRAERAQGRTRRVSGLRRHHRLAHRSASRRHSLREARRASTSRRARPVPGSRPRPGLRSRPREARVVLVRLHEPPHDRKAEPEAVAPRSHPARSDRTPARAPRRSSPDPRRRRAARRRRSRSDRPDGDRRAARRDVERVCEQVVEHLLQPSRGRQRAKRRLEPRSSATPASSARAAQTPSRSATSPSRSTASGLDAADPPERAREGRRRDRDSRSTSASAPSSRPALEARRRARGSRAEAAAPRAASAADGCIRDERSCERTRWSRADTVSLNVESETLPPAVLDGGARGQVPHRRRRRLLEVVERLRYHRARAYARAVAARSTATATRARIDQ